MNLVLTGYGEWPALFLIGNWISPKTEGSAWFIEVYLQLLLALAVFFMVPKVRNVFAATPFQTTAIMAFILVLVAAISDFLVDTNHLFRRLPHLYAWIFFIGLAAGAARNNFDRVLVTGIFCLGRWQFGGYGNILPMLTGYFPLAVFSLIWIPAFPVPRIASGILRSVAGASLMIYLSHFQFASLSKSILGGPVALTWLVAIAGGVVLWRAYEFFEKRARSVLLKRK